MELQLRNKIISLFEYRRLPELISFGNVSWDSDYYELLIELQYQIYKLDHELETSWEVDMNIVQERWNCIYKALKDLGISKSEHDGYCKHIYKYQKHELEIRQSKLPTRLSMEYFYFYKSCDVKLLRKIIYRNNPSLSIAVKESSWRLFDLVTEVNDDVCDLQEDISTINGNRFLIGLCQQGKKKTNKVFSNFLKEISDRNKQHPESSEILKTMKTWTDVQVEETLLLLDQQTKVFDQLNVGNYAFIYSEV